MVKFLAILTISVFLPFLILAADPVKIENPLGNLKFEEIVGKLLDFVFKIALVLAPLMIVIGGFLLVTSGGNPQRSEQARNLILWTAVGLLIIIMSKGIISVINQLLGSK